MPPSNPSSGGTQSVISKTELPGWVNDAAQKNLDMAYQVSNNMRPYDGPRYAGMTTGMGTDIAALQHNVGSTNPAYAMAQNGAAGIMNYAPQNVQSGSYNAALVNGVPQVAAERIAAERIGQMPTLRADQVNAGYLANANLNPYMNPYTSSVVDYGLKSLETQRQQALNGIGDQAIRSGAFGGSRQGVSEGVTNAGAALNAGKLASDLMSQNFLQAQAAATGDINRNLQAQQLNQGANLQAGTTNLATMMQRALANQSAGMDAQRLRLQAQLANQGALMQAAFANQAAMNRGSEFNIGNNLQAQLANQSAGLQGAGLNLNAANALGSLAGAGQGAYLDSLRAAMAGQGMYTADQQGRIDAARSAWADANQLPLQQLQIPLQALGMTPYGQTQTTTGPAQPQASSSGLMQGLGLASSGIGLLGGIGSMAAGPGQSALAGLGSLFSALPFSDETEKTDIKKVGTDPETGVGMYSYRYKGDPKTYPKVVGPMAQEIAEKYPDQVHNVAGKLAVNLGFPSMRKAFN